MSRLFLASVGLVALATNAAAQEQQTVAAEEAAAVEEDAGGIADIVVTASRRAENVQNAALSIQALDSEALTRANVSRPEDLAAVAPGVQIGTAGPYAQPYVRGVGNYATNSLAESPIAMNFDGVYIARSWATRGMFYDLDRVEVLKGPQGTLYGRNASGGAINVISTKPRIGETSGFVEGQFGNYGHVQGTAALNVPVSDTFAVRASGQVIDRDGYLSDGYDDEKSEAARLQFLIEPRDDFSLILAGNYQHIHGRGVGGGVLTRPAGEKFLGATDNPLVQEIFQAEPFLGPVNVFPQKDGFSEVTIYSLSAEMNWDLGFATFTLLPAFRDATLEGLQYSPGFSVYNNEHNEQTSVEARLGNDGGRFKWVLGGYYYDERTTNPDAEPGLIVLQGVSATVQSRIKGTTRSYAAFGQGTYEIVEGLRATAGLRYTYERKTDDELTQSYSFPNEEPPLCANGEFDPDTVSPPLFCRLDIPNSGKLTYNSVTWKAGVEFDVAPRSMAYANVSTGFKSGGFFPLAPAPNTFRPEKLTSFEAGIKNRFFDNRLQVNLEAFFWRYKDHQESYLGPTSIPGVFAFITTNAGRAKSYGLDTDIMFRPTLDDEFSLKVQYNKSNYDDFRFQNLTAVFGPPVTGCAVGPVVDGEQTVDCSGQSLIRAPLWSGTASYSHTFDMGESGSLRAGVDTQFSSATYLSIDFLEAGRQKAFAITNADLTYETADRGLSITGYVHNIFNEMVFNQVFRSPFVSPNNPIADPDGVLLGTVRPPRTYGLRARYNF
ncbi:TonB-dependent receptor [Croceicoccus bisphenolivorans]|uniref:TonB-dependent receptor n=1 Tax=Croceicoccus bisphenolivorans TaxID=1783232 RepID=UPI00082FCC2A|nr:TonB-dependent receptor [Croceicoccus bisphenolivorans]